MVVNDWPEQPGLPAPTNDTQRDQGEQSEKQTIVNCPATLEPDKKTRRVLL